MIGLMLIVIVSGVIGMRIGNAIEEKRFQSAVDRLFVELESCRRLALSSEADWIALFEKRDGCFWLRKSCPEMGKERLVSWRSSCEIRFNSEAVRTVSFQFTSSGKVAPEGVLSFEDGKRKLSWRLPDQFAVFETQ